jgi:uncharacterized Rmd1/YagE family protein
VAYKDKEKRREYDKRRYQANKEQRDAQHQQYCVENRERVNAIRRKSYQTNIEQEKARMYKQYQDNPGYFNDRNAVRRQELREFLQEQKMGRVCARCGNSDFRVLDFHHLDRDGKEGGLSQAVAKNWGKERILREIDKCEVLCANCHRILHWEERNNARPVPRAAAES